MAAPVETKTAVKIAVIGGSGLNKPDILENVREIEVDTPFGKPSDSLICGQINGVDCILLCRHGRHHTINPTNVNYRANIWALKEAGCTNIVATTACGSLQEDIKPGDFVFLDQFVDRTTKRLTTFYDGGADSPKGVCHIMMNEPFCPLTRKILIECATQLHLRQHPVGTNVTIEGPRFSTRAESRLFQSWGCHVVNMTTVPEVVLANELGLSYASIALVTDYDSWKEHEDAVCASTVINVMRENAAKVKDLLFHAIPKIAQEDFADLVKAKKAIAVSSIM